MGCKKTAAILQPSSSSGVSVSGDPMYAMLGICAGMLCWSEAGSSIQARADKAIHYDSSDLPSSRLPYALLTPLFDIVRCLSRTPPSSTLGPNTTCICGWPSFLRNNYSYSSYKRTIAIKGCDTVATPGLTFLLWEYIKSETTTRFPSTLSHQPNFSE